MSHIVRKLPINLDLDEIYSPGSYETGTLELDGLEYIGPIKFDGKQVAIHRMKHFANWNKHGSITFITDKEGKGYYSTDPYEDNNKDNMTMEQALIWDETQEADEDGNKWVPFDLAKLSYDRTLKSWKQKYLYLYNNKNNETWLKDYIENYKYPPIKSLPDDATDDEKQEHEARVAERDANVAAYSDARSDGNIDRYAEEAAKVIKANKFGGGTFNRIENFSFGEDANGVQVACISGQSPTPSWNLPGYFCPTYLLSNDLIHWYPKYIFGTSNLWGQCYGQGMFMMNVTSLNGTAGNESGNAFGDESGDKLYSIDDFYNYEDFFRWRDQNTGGADYAKCNPNKNTSIFCGKILDANNLRSAQPFFPLQQKFDKDNQPYFGDEFNKGVSQASICYEGGFFVLSHHRNYSNQRRRLLGRQIYNVIFDEKGRVKFYNVKPIEEIDFELEESLSSAKTNFHADVLVRAIAYDGKNTIVFGLQAMPFLYVYNFSTGEFTWLKFFDIYPFPYEPDKCDESGNPLPDQTDIEERPRSWEYPDTFADDRNGLFQDIWTEMPTDDKVNFEGIKGCTYHQGYFYVSMWHYLFKSNDGINWELVQMNESCKPAEGLIKMYGIDIWDGVNDDNVYAYIPTLNPKSSMYKFNDHDNKVIIKEKKHVKIDFSDRLLGISEYKTIPSQDWSSLTSDQKVEKCMAKIDELTKTINMIIQGLRYAEG